MNKRYFKTTDVVLFEDDTVKLDIVPKQIFNSVIDVLYKNAFVKSNKLQKNCSLTDIDPSFEIDKNDIIKGINEELDTSVTTIDEAMSVVEIERYKRLQTLIDTKFSKENLLKLLDWFEMRNDEAINTMVTNNADIPTIFEYVLGIIWYKVSNRKGKILDYMKLSLDSDLLPKSHAVGGEADIVYEYPVTYEYPEHALLLEATLACAGNQRRMEMEPVSRHLGQHLLRTRNYQSYCIFVTNYLDINVNSDFRNRKNAPYYSTQDNSEFVEGMKIIPLQTGELKLIIRKDIKYDEIYRWFEDAYISALAPNKWYDKCIKERLQEYDI